MKHRIPLAVLLATLVAAPMAIAKPVAANRAVALIRSDRWLYPNDTPTVRCAKKHYGTMCVASSGTCYADGTLGTSWIVSRDLLWVSRTRGRLSARSVGQLPYVIGQSDCKLDYDPGTGDTL